MTESSQRAHKPKCSVWQHYDKDVDPEGRTTVTCKYCSQIYTSSVAKNATRLRQHLTRRCPEAPDEVKMSFPEESEENIKLKDDSKTSEDVPKTSKRKSSLRPKTIEIKTEVEEEEDVLWKDDVSIDSDSKTDRPKDMKTLEEENRRLSSKLKICLKQKETLLKINKYLDKSLSLMQKLDVISKNYGSDENEVQELEDQLNASNVCIKDWKQKYDLIEFNQKMKSLYKTSGPPLPNRLTFSHSGKGHRPQSTIWQYFKDLSKPSDDLKTIRCKFCQKEFRYKHLNATKCRTHIVESCEKVPEDVRQEENNWIEYRPQSKVDIWQHFSITTEDDDKTIAECLYCGHKYSGRNATKCRGHLVGKCERIPEHIRDSIVGQCDTDFICSSQSISKSSKISSIWRHFDIEEEDGKISCVCIYCRHLFSYKNATKCRRHLTDKCPTIPTDVRLDITQESEESGRRWTQTKIPIWDHFEANTSDGKECFKCIYCGFNYGYKNATKLRMHLLSKCPDIPDNSLEKIRDQCKESYLNGIQNKSEVKIRVKKMKVRRVVTKKDCERTGRKPKCSVWQHFKDMSDSVSAIRLDCIYCSQSFNYRNATKMKKHLANICKSCPLDIKAAHKELDDGTVRPYRRRVPTLPGMHDCCWPGCDLKFAKLSRLRNHQLQHMGVQSRIKCDWPGCEWTGRSKTDVKIHRCIHTGEKPYVCDWPGCDFKTAKPSSLWVHKRRHKELFRFPCDWPGCERQFLTQWERQRHKNTHLGLKPFGCQYCDKRYPIAYKLKVHQKKQHLNQITYRS